MNDQKSPKVVLYGGNGFVGVHTAQKLSKAGADVVCLSRTGHKPLHLKEQQWGAEVRWCKGDASEPNIELLATADVMICLVGSAPIPTFSKSAYEQQLFMNGTTCINAINGAAQAGLKKVILLGAKIPFFLRTKYFAYNAGKQLALNSAKDFADLAENNTSIVLQPGMVTGRRILNSGKAIRLDWMTSPLAPVMPGQFVPIERLAKRIEHAVFNQQPYLGKCTIITGREI